MKKSNICIAADNMKMPPVIETDLTGQTVVVVGANTGIGFDATKHFATMNPARLILACRSKERGEAALQRVKTETGYSKAELKLVDLSQYSSVKAFADAFEEENARLDIVVVNAAILTYNYGVSSHGFEDTLQVNVINSTYLSLLLLPQMNRTAETYSVTPRLVGVSSFVHYNATIEQKVLDSPNIYEKMSSKEYCNSSVMSRRYTESKLLHLLLLREVAARTPSHKVLVTLPNPGFCATEITRSVDGLFGKMIAVSRYLASFTSEEGSRQIVWAAIGGKPKDEAKSKGEPHGLYQDEQLHGQYINLSHVDEMDDWVLGPKGQEVQSRLWKETVELLSKTDSRISEIVAALA